VDEVNSTMKQLGLSRLFLHAAKLQFYLPGEIEPTVVSAPLSAELEALLSKLVAL